MQITLTPDLERYVSEKVRTGQFRSPSEVIADALETMKAQEDLTPGAATEMRRLVQAGAQQADRGELTDWNADETRAELRQYLRDKNGNR